jgi:hypothetical protein
VDLKKKEATDNKVPIDLSDLEKKFRVDIVLDPK